MSAHESDRGVATVWAAGALAVLVAVLLAGLNLGAALSARHRAEAAADLAALAAAAHADGGEAAACAQAARVVAGFERASAERTSPRLASCRLAGLDVLVEVQVTAALSFGSAGTAMGRARAGPAEETTR